MTKTNLSSVRPPTESKEGASLEIEDPSQISTISNDRDQYILMWHGTLELDPLPSSSPRDPLNWPTWKKDVHVLMVAFHAMMTTFTAACIIPGFHSFALKYGTSIEQASYLTSAQILALGLFPLIWNPISKHFGRRPAFLISTLGSCVCNIGGVFCTSYGAQMTSRILTAIFICPPLGIGSGVVTELFFKHERAQKMGWWTLMTTLGTPMGPLIMGFIVQHLNVNWIFSILAIINFCQFLGYLLLDTETLYLPSNAAMNLQKSQGRFTFSRIDKTPFSVLDCLAPFYICRHLKIVIPACAYALVFCYANIAIIVEMPIIFGEKFGLDAQSIGLQYIALIIGSVLGEQLSGPLSDAFLNRYSRRTGHSHPVHRLWISYVGFLTVILGILVWGIQLQHAKQGVWNVTPLVGAAIASFGNQIITTTIITFAVDNYREKSADIGVIVNFIRQVWGFIGPFYFPLIFGNLGFAASAGIFCSIIFAFGCLPVVGLHVQGRDRKPAGEVV